MTNTKKAYDGHATSADEQIDTLKKIGLIIKNPSTAKQRIGFIGYYRFCSYVKPFIFADPLIKPGTSFEQVWDLYVFDRKLRLLVIDAIERIEVAFRVSISEVMSCYSPFWYTDALHFKELKWHLEFMNKVLEITRKPQHNLIRHFYEKYSSPDFPPSWIITECLTFGTWSKVFDNLKARSDKIAISNRLDTPFIVLLSWIKSLTELRNLCAHHERIWNQFFRHTPKNVPNEQHQAHRFYQQAYVIDKLLSKIDPQSTWKNDLKLLMSHYSHLPLEKMGFDDSW